MSPELEDGLTRPFEDEEDAFMRQLALAQALRTNNAAQHSTPLGAGLAGLGDMLGAYASGQKMRSAEEGLAALRKDKQSAAKGAYGHLSEQQRALLAALEGMGQSQQPASPAGLTLFPEGY
jgi:hypothetical protein